MAGAAALSIMGLFVELSPEAARVLTWTLGLSLLVNLLLTAGGEFAVPHASSVAATAARMITHGRYAPHYWGSLAGGLALPLAAILLAPGSAAALAARGRVVPGRALRLRVGFRDGPAASSEQLTRWKVT